MNRYNNSDENFESSNETFFYVAQLRHISAPIDQYVVYDRCQTHRNRNFYIFKIKIQKENILIIAYCDYIGQQELVCSFIAQILVVLRQIINLVWSLFHLQGRKNIILVSFSGQCVYCCNYATLLADKI